jgi:hypothetical protein
MLQSSTGNGGIGAAIVNVASEAVMVAGLVALVPHELLDRRSLYDAARICVAGLATGLAVTAAMPQGLVAAIPAGGVAYVIVTGMLRTVNLTELRTLRSIR